METMLTATKSISINSTPEKVWKALTDPALIKKYLFGTNTVTDWKVGSPIHFYGEWEGKKYEDKGIIKAINPNKFIHYTYWSSMSGLEDKPENYADVRYILSEKGNQTTLTIEQDGSKNEESRKHSEQNWGLVLDGLKKVVEGL
jgi:uncharacterized protein YndB with AHSA1/START domain